MNRKSFWKIIDDVLKSVNNIYDVAPILTAKLQELPTSEIISFKQHQSDLMSESYRYDIWAIAYILNGGCSGDCFEYFRGWLMTYGQERWESVLMSPESIKEWIDSKEFVYEYEAIFYVASNAFMAKTGQDFPHDEINMSYPQRPIGKSWTEDELENLYPKLNVIFA